MGKNEITASNFLNKYCFRNRLTGIENLWLPKGKWGVAGIN